MERNDDFQAWSHAAANAIVVDMTTEEARKLIDDLATDFDELTVALDEAQGPVFEKQQAQAYVLLRIKGS